MNSNVGLYDTFKDKDGRRYRVIEVGNDTAKLVRLNEDGTRKSRAAVQGSSPSRTFSRTTAASTFRRSR
jgi:hypothetical protein